MPSIAMLAAFAIVAAWGPRTLAGLGLLFVVVLTGQAPAAPNGGVASLQAVDRYLVGKVRSARIPGLAIGIVRGDSVIYLRAYGRADPSGRAVTPQTPFLIGSITKSFTALAVLQLVDSGEVELDAPVQRYLPWFRVADSRASAEITVRHLLTQTSGIPQSYETQLWTEQDDRALERAVRLLQSAKLTGPPGSSFGYSNANYETLGMIVQAVSGLSYEEYVRQRIFAPLAMRNSFVSQDEARQHGMASGYRWWFGLPVPANLAYHRAELPAGYIIASAEDMTHLLIAEMNAGRYGNVSVLSPQGMALRHEPPAMGYGFGWEFVRNHGRLWINHDGGTANFQSSLFLDPDLRVGVFVAANVINALDAFASVSGSTPLDGATTREMAQVVLSMVTSQPLPRQGPGHERLTLIFDIVIAALTAVLVISLIRFPARLRRLAQRGFSSRAALVRHRGLVIAVSFPWAIILAVLALRVPVWKVLTQFQPDLVYWLYGIAMILLVMGVSELVVARRVRR